MAAPEKIPPDATRPPDARRMLETAVDRHLLHRLSAEEVREALDGHVDLPPRPFFELLIAPGNAPRRTKIEQPPVVLGSYLSSRLLLRGFVLFPDITGCLYALADAVRGLSPVDVVRWRFVVSRLLRWTPRHAVARRVLRQTGVVVALLAELADPEEFGWEIDVLKNGRMPWFSRRHRDAGSSSGSHG